MSCDAEPKVEAYFEPLYTYILTDTYMYVFTETYFTSTSICVCVQK